MPPRIPALHMQQSICPQCLQSRLLEVRRTAAAAVHATQAFHTSQPNHARRTALRREMFQWLNGPGKAFREPRAGSTNYLSAYSKYGELKRGGRYEQRSAEEEAELDEDEAVLVERDEEAGLSAEAVQKRSKQRQRRREERDTGSDLSKERASDLHPYPLNKHFRSQAVLSEELRQNIYKLVVEDGIDLKSVSAAFGVDVRRVAAVVRLMSLENEWIKEGKQLAKPYNKAVLAMLPTTPYRQPGKESLPPPHEPINDLPVHPYTRQQIFLPTSESRAFTRADAAKAFHPSLLPADERIPHTEMLQMTKWENEGYDRETRQQLQREKDATAEIARARKERQRKQWEERTQVVVPGRRWDFRFQDVSAEMVGKDGRGRHAVGIRYGMPHEDRKKGQVKIPTKVE